MSLPCLNGVKPSYRFPPSLPLPWLLYLKKQQWEGDRDLVSLILSYHKLTIHIAQATNEKPVIRGKVSCLGNKGLSTSVYQEIFLLILHFTQRVYKNAYLRGCMACILPFNLAHAVKWSPVRLFLGKLKIDCLRRWKVDGKCARLQENILEIVKGDNMKWMNFFSWRITESLFRWLETAFLLENCSAKLQNFNSLIRKMWLPLVTEDRRTSQWTIYTST